jgi:hypothetical protein
VDQWSPTTLVSACDLPVFSRSIAFFFFLYIGLIP